MKPVVYSLSIFFALIFATFYAAAERRITNTLAKDVSEAYGFCLGQEYSLKKIAKKYPSLSGPAYIAEKEFVATFGSSIEAMDELMSKHAKAEWDKIKSEGARQFTSTLDIELINEKQAREFVELVRQRAKGNIESPVLETLLLFESNYEAHPEREFLAGYKYSFSSAESTKAKGVHFTIEAPRTWAAKEGKRPNIVQKFVSENGRGPGFLVIQVKDLPLAPGEKVTARDVEEMLNPKGIRDFLPDGATYINSGRITLENLPGLWVRFKAGMSRVRNVVEMETIIYVVFYEKKMIQIQGHVVTAFNTKQVESGGFGKYEKLFDLMANSFVIHNMYK